MIEQDTIRLLRESDAGIKMGISSLEDSMKHIKSNKFHEIAQKSLHNHQMLQTEMQTLLADYHDDGKEPAMMAKGMEWFKTNVSLAMDACDGAVADFLVDGCNMGVKSLARYLNEYKAADEKSKDIAKNSSARKNISAKLCGISYKGKAVSPAKGDAASLCRDTHRTFLRAIAGTLWCGFPLILAAEIIIASIQKSRRKWSFQTLLCRTYQFLLCLSCRA